MDFWINLAEKASRSLKNPEWLGPYRTQALQSFLAKPWPEVRDSPGIKYTKMDDKRFIDMAFAHNLSLKSNSNSIIPLRESFDLVRENFGKTLDLENKIEAMLAAFASDGFVCIADKPGTIVIELLNENPIFTHNFIIAKEGVSASIIIKDNSKKMHNSLTEIFAEENSDLKIVRLCTAQTINVAKVHAAKDCQISWFECLKGAKLSKHEEFFDLDGEGASLAYSSICIGKEDDHIDLSNHAMHSAANTSSNLLSKAALGGFAKGVYKGMITIAPNAAKSSAKLTQRVLLLSQDAHSNAIPGLDIQNNDVQAAHAASTEYTSDEQLFYLQTRGLSSIEAQKLIAYGFLQSVVNLNPVPQADDDVRKLVGGAMA